MVFPASNTLGHQIPSVHPLICHFRSFLISRILKSRRKPFPRSCPLKIKDSVMVSSHERVETLKLWKRTRLSPNPKDFLVFPVKRCPLAMRREERPKHAGITLHIYVLLCMFPSTAQTTTRTLWDVCTWERWMGAQAASPSLSAASRRRLEKRDGEGTRADGHHSGGHGSRQASISPLMAEGGASSKVIYPLLLK